MAFDLSKFRKRREKRARPLAFVLSGGGPLGAVQVGLIQALFQEGIVPDFVVGTSVGALNAVAIAHDPTSAGALALRNVWTQMRSDDLFPGGRLVSAWHAFKRGSHVFSNTGLRRIIATLGVETFEELLLPSHIVATNLETGGETWFNSGPIIDPLLASSAMPGIFCPVTIAGVPYIDGGIANNVPVGKAVELGARKIYLLNVSGVTQRRELSRPHDFAMHGLVLARAQRYRLDIERYRDKAEIIEFPPADVGHVAFTNLSQTPRLIDAGFTAGLEFLRSSAPASAAFVQETG